VLGRTENCTVPAPLPEPSELIEMKSAFVIADQTQSAAAVTSTDSDPPPEGTDIAPAEMETEQTDDFSPYTFS
jgi:hypothetical protein